MHSSRVAFSSLQTQQGWVGRQCLRPREVAGRAGREGATRRERGGEIGVEKGGVRSELVLGDARGVDFTFTAAEAVPWGLRSAARFEGAAPGGRC